MESLKSDAEIRAIVLHENLHVALKHLTFGKGMFKENAKLANIAADMVVNNMIDDIKDQIRSGPLLSLPDHAVIDPEFKNWSMREVYDFLKKNCDNGGDGEGGDGSEGNEEGEGEGSGSPPPDGEKGKININGKEFDLSQSDDHDYESTPQTPEEVKAQDEKIERALREGAMLAGKLGGKVPREISDLLTPKVDWRDELRDFVTSSMKGKDEFTWRKTNRRMLANGILYPGIEDESINRMVVAIDTSGSITGQQITEFATELLNICDVVQPD
jgi:predicted metal-dependent peptidase